MSCSAVGTGVSVLGATAGKGAWMYAGAYGSAITANPAPMAAGAAMEAAAGLAATPGAPEAAQLACEFGQQAWESEMGRMGEKGSGGNVAAEWHSSDTGGANAGAMESWAREAQEYFHGKTSPPVDIGDLGEPSESPSKSESPAPKADAAPAPAAEMAPEPPSAPAPEPSSDKGEGQSRPDAEAPESEGQDFSQPSLGIDLGDSEPTGDPYPGDFGSEGFDFDPSFDYGAAEGLSNLA